MNNWLPWVVVLPLSAAFLIPLTASRGREWVTDALGNAIMLGLVMLAAGSVGQAMVYHVGAWATPLGIDLRVDGLTSLMLLCINVIGFASTLFSVPYMRMYTDKTHYYSLFLLMVAGMNGVAVTGDLFNLYVFMEIAAIASYALVAFGCDHEELEASFKYTVLGGLASAFILIGIAVMYAATGTLNMAHIAARLSQPGIPADPVKLAIGLFACGFAMKTALVPFHAWLPDAHPSAPAPVSAMLSGVVIKALGIYALTRLLFNVFGVSAGLLAGMRWLGLLSMVAGVMLAIGQWDMKRLFAYHSISQIGYVALGIGLGTPLGLVGGLFHMLNHSVFKSLLFLNAGAVEYATGTRDLKRLGGLAASMPVTARTSLVASLSIAGVPPFNGFWSKLLIVVACVQSGYYGAAIAAVLVSLVTLASFLKVQRYAFYEASRPATAAAREVPAFMQAAMLILALLCVGAALLVWTGLGAPMLIKPAADALLAGLPGIT